MAYVQHTMKGDGMVQNLRQGQQSVGARIETMVQFRADRPQYSRWWRALAYMAAFLPFLSLVFFAWKDPDFNRQKISGWKPVVALAQASRERGDLIEARGLYSRAGRIAASQDDWTGILASACGVYKLGSESGPYSATRSFLLRAMTAAEKRQSRAGIAAVMNALERTGTNNDPAMVLARVQPQWPEETQDSVDSYKNECW